MKLQNGHRECIQHTFSPNNTSIRIDTGNKRYVGRNWLGTQKRFPWGGRNFTEESLTRAWEAACAWCEVEAHSNTTKSIVHERLADLSIRKPSEALPRMQWIVKREAKAAFDAELIFEVHAQNSIFIKLF